MLSSLSQTSFFDDGSEDGREDEGGRREERRVERFDPKTGLKVEEESMTRGGGGGAGSRRAGGPISSTERTHPPCGLCMVGGEVINRLIG